MTLQELLASNTALPSIPKIVTSLLSALNCDEPDLRAISQLINTDPVLATRLLQLANSAQFQLSSKVSSVSEALALAGFDQIRTLATTAAIAGAFKMVKGIDVQQFWSYSLNVAKLARTFAGMARQNRSTAFTTGLIHATGELVLHLGMPREMASLNQKVTPLDLQRASAEQALLGFTYADVGAGFARNWQFPQPIVSALAQQCRPLEQRAAEPLAGVLQLAQWRARARESQCNDAYLAANFPNALAEPLGIERQEAVQNDLIEWTLPSEVDALT